MPPLLSRKNQLGFSRFSDYRSSVRTDWFWELAVANAEAPACARICCRDKFEVSAAKSASVMLLCAEVTFAKVVCNAELVPSKVYF